MKRGPEMRPWFPRNCAVREFTADGVPVGRCMCFVGHGYVCPRHGNVVKVQERYIRTGELTNERDLAGER